MPKTEAGLFEALEQELRASAVPLDAVDLFERREIKKHAASVNRVSDYLGHLWRKGRVSRTPTARDDARVRWQYRWNKPSTTPRIVPPDEAFQDYRAAPKVLEENGVLVFDLPHYVVTIKLK